MNIKNTIILFLLLSSFAFSDNDDNAIYLLYPGPNLVSFGILNQEQNIEEFFSPIEENIVSVISQGQIGFFNNNQWVGGLEAIDNLSGYWVIVDDISLLDVSGTYNNAPLYFLYPGANLISYPYNTSQSVTNAISNYTYENFYAIIGENQAALFTDAGIFGSLTEFEPNKAYWFFMINANPFTYNQPNQFISNNNSSNTLDDDIDNDYEQSVNQSVFFVENAFLSGQNINLNSHISIYCNNTKVGGKAWIGNMTDVIAMGNDGYGYTDNYCEESQDILIKHTYNEIETDMNIIGNNLFSNNNISIISLSDVELGDLNFDNNLNITDIVILIEHIIDINEINNNHQLLLSDSNQDDMINVTDLIFNLTLILE